MCGIAGIILKNPSALQGDELIVRMTEAIKHRGPDGEGFIIASPSETLPYFGKTFQQYEKKELPYIPKKLITRSENSFLFFGHRRLSIIDTSESGHQPMSDPAAKKWIVYNGEIYNYVELRAELIASGHHFKSTSDTEVILHAYEQWGPECVKKFNGMWAFCIYDTVKNICFASRDRLGVKPFYYTDNQSLFSFASEQKAFVKAGLITAQADDQVIANYLLNGLLEYKESNFFQSVLELFPGHNLIYDLIQKKVRTEKYYDLKESFSNKNDHLSESQLVEKISWALEESVRLRLRSDVEVGTCLSGGIDSSVLAVLMAEQTDKPVHCFTSVFRGRAINEEKFADIVTRTIRSKHYKIEPTLQDFRNEVDDLIYSQDVPIWSTSTFAQHKVMALAQQHKIKVVLDGQGADELFAGYHHHFVAKWNNLFSTGKFIEGVREINQAKTTFKHPHLFYLKEKIKENYELKKNKLASFFEKEFLQHAFVNQVHRFNDVNEQLYDDIYRTRLKSFLKCEDRCGMWHSVESRTPFSDDINLIDLLFSFHGNKKIKNGISKYLLREATKKKLPSEIYTRYDKVGFLTPMKDWVNEMRSEIIEDISSSEFKFVDIKRIKNINLNSNIEMEFFFKLYVLSRWKKVFIS